MDFFARAAAIALSVLASLFTNVEAPKAQAKAAPVVSRASLSHPAQVVVYSTSKSAKGQPMKLVILSRPSVPMPLDSESERFLAWIGKGQSGTKPLAVNPWYTQTDLFSTPTVDGTADILRALLVDDRDQ